MYRVFKLRQALLNGAALLVVAAGMIAGSICEKNIMVTCLAAWGTVLKGWNDFKRFINLFFSSKTSNLCGIIGVENGIPEQGSHSTDKKSVGKRECCVCEGGNVYV